MSTNYNNDDSLQTLYKKFWERFNLYSEKSLKFCQVFQPHSEPTTRSYQDYRVEHPYLISVGINFKRHEVRTKAYFWNLETLKDVYKNKKKIIDSSIDKELVWKFHETSGYICLFENVDFNASEGWKKAFKIMINNMIILNQIVGNNMDQKRKRFTNRDKTKYWIVPSNEKSFHLAKWLKNHDYVCWKWGSRSTPKIGDIVFMYRTLPYQKIQYMFEIVETNVSSVLVNQQSAYWGKKRIVLNPDSLYIKLDLLDETDNNQLSFETLQDLGLLGNIWGPRTVSGDILDHILACFDVEQMEEDEEEVVVDETDEDEDVNNEEEEVDEDEVDEEDDDETDEDEEEDSEYIEGETHEHTITTYERDHEARKKCIEVHGCKCAVCGLDFESMYGEIGQGFIEVHHIVPISSIKESYHVDPVNDLVPVCPNCHAMLHKGPNGTVLSVAKLKEIIHQRQKSKGLIDKLFRRK